MDNWPDGSLLGTLPARSREALLRIGTSAVYERGRRIIAEGDESTFVILILAGCVKITGYLDDGREALLAIRARGDVVGELAAFDAQPRVASVIACGNLRGRVIRQGDFLRYLRTDPDANPAIHRMLGDRLRQATRRRLDFTGCEAPVRIARVLVELSETYGRPAQHGVRSGVRLAQHELATLSATSRETVERTLHALRTQGTLATSYREFTVLDRSALHAFAHLCPLADHA